jgi:hypothetical protein
MITRLKWLDNELSAAKAAYRAARAKLSEYSVMSPEWEQLNQKCNALSVKVESLRSRKAKAGVRQDFMETYQLVIKSI